jgi:hypothetical protein
MQALLRNPDLARKAGLTDEDLERVRDITFEAQKETIRARADQEIAGMELRRLMQADDSSREAVMEAVEKVGRLRTEMQKKHVEQRFLIREALGEEKIRKVKESMRKRGEQKERASRQRGKTGRRGQGPGDGRGGGPGGGQGDGWGGWGGPPPDRD